MWEDNLRETGSGVVIAWGCTWNGVSLFRGTEFQFYKRSEFCRWVAGMVALHCAWR